MFLIIIILNNAALNLWKSYRKMCFPNDIFCFWSIMNTIKIQKWLIHWCTLMMIKQYDFGLIWLIWFFDSQEIQLEFQSICTLILFVQDICLMHLSYSFTFGIFFNKIQFIRLKVQNVALFHCIIKDIKMTIIMFKIENNVFVLLLYIFKYPNVRSYIYLKIYKIYIKIQI